MARRLASQQEDFTQRMRQRMAQLAQRMVELTGIPIPSMDGTTVLTWEEGWKEMKIGAFTRRPLRRRPSGQIHGKCGLKR